MINKNHRNLNSSGRTATFYSGVPDFETLVTYREFTLKYETFVLFYIYAVNQRALKRK
jgi:hypothetical protein